MLRDLDKRDTLVLKGLAISAIVFHNFCHLAGPVHQDELTFKPARFPVFLKSLHDPTTAITGCFSFFGHFGVDIFIFLAAYGLAKSQWDDPAPWARFLWARISKLYPIFALVVLPWFILMAHALGLVHTLNVYGAKLAWMFAGVSNLIPGYGLPPIGPWWFIPFIVQFYALWPFLRRLTIDFGPPGLLVLAVSSLILVTVANQFLVRQSMTLLDTPIGHMPEFCLGIMAARYQIRFSARVVTGAAVILLLGSIYRDLWPLTFVCALILSLALYLRMRSVLRESRFLMRIGEYSMLIFLLNGILRYEFMSYAHSPRSLLFYACVNAAMSFAVAAIIQEFFLPRSLAEKLKLAPRAARDADKPNEVFLPDSPFAGGPELAVQEE
jgi:peptidoglycan/LPS O-acetylase OafA/YrhL